MIRKSIPLVWFCVLCIPNRVWAQSQPEVSVDVKHDVSPALHDLPRSPSPSEPKRERRLRLTHGPRELVSQPDPALQSSAGPLVNTAAGQNFQGVGIGIDNSYFNCCAPPDTNGAAGATQYVQWVNLDFAVFDKTTGISLRALLQETHCGTVLADLARQTTAATPSRSMTKQRGGGCWRSRFTFRRTCIA